MVTWCRSRWQRVSKRRELTILERAVPKGRPRFTKSGHVYTPPTTRAWEDRIAWAWRSTYPGEEPFDGPVEVHMLFKGKRRLPGDLSNYVKAAEDALNGLAWVDDRQIVESHAFKLTGSVDLVWIIVTEWREP